MHGCVLVAVALGGLVVAAAPAVASPADHCRAELTARGVSHRPATRPGIAIGVEITGPVGGVTYVAGNRTPLVIDCSLAVSLAEAGSYLRALGVEQVVWSSAYSRRTVRGTGRPSKHSFGLAIDVPRLVGKELGALAVIDDYEQGLGDRVDCLGQPATQGGAILKVMQCQLARSGLFHLVLSPDYDDAHHDHFHLEALPWTERPTVRAERPAIH
ncbi:MAG: extensin family protein [Kofleriaceae bacterium]|nr:extensin family protein [Kofleriaceae bacterium]MCL4225135.1 extensin family protein [Myxococcales bacterium]